MLLAVLVPSHFTHVERHCLSVTSTWDPFFISDLIANVQVELNSLEEQALMDRKQLKAADGGSV